MDSSSSPFTPPRRKKGLSAEDVAPSQIVSEATSSPNSNTSLDLGNGRGGGTVYVQHGTNQIEQPKVYNERRLDNSKEVLVAKFKYKEFVWWNECLTGDLPPLYKQILEKLRAWKSYYDFELQGFTCFRHKEDKSRKCDVEHIYLPQVRCGKYHPYASIKHKRRACMRTLERLEYLEKKVKKLNGKSKRGKFDYLVKLTLTLPKHVSLEWDNEETQVRIRNARKRLLELLHDKRFPKKKSEFGVICNNHYWSTKRPLEPHRHLHLTVPNVCYNSSENKFYRFSPYIKEKVIKKCWKKALVEHGLWVERKNEKGEEVLPDCWVNYIKFSHRDKVINWLSYCCRKPSEDMITYLRAEDLECFDKDDEEFAGFLLDYTPRVVNLGFLTNLKRFGYYSNKSKTMICPICGGEMSALHDENGLIHTLDRPPPGNVKLLRDRKGIWYALS